jgi:hypothetical protein
MAPDFGTISYSPPLDLAKARQGTTATVSCLTGYKVSHAENRRTCNEGQWSLPEVSCVSNTPPYTPPPYTAPPPPPSVGCSSQAFFSPGVTPAGATLRPAANQFTHMYADGAQVSVSCAPGYEISNVFSSRKTCTAGRWVGSTVSCNPAPVPKCPALVVPGGSAHYTHGYDLDSVATVICRNGFTASSASCPTCSASCPCTRTCSAGSVWGGQEVACSAFPPAPQLISQSQPQLSFAVVRSHTKCLMPRCARCRFQRAAAALHAAAAADE